MAAPAEGVTFSSWARSPQPEWPYKLVEPDTAPKLTPTSVTARIAIVDALYAHAKPADDPRLPIPTPAKKKRPGGPSPRPRRPPAGDARAARRRERGPGRHAAAGATPAKQRPEAVVDFLRSRPWARLLRRAGAAPALPLSRRLGALKPEAARLSAAFAPPSSPPRNAARARAASPAVAEDYCAPCEAPAPAPEAAGRPAGVERSTLPMPTEYLHDCELGCGATYRLQKKAQHLGEECPKRLVLCKDCGERYVFENAKAHRDLV
ncbi:hypothetical protein JL721_9603 [Aureococcus anophagefferens]|nr:hypothetical protein JL721_9603 [Aureococcus anophagefferens]